MSDPKQPLPGRESKFLKFLTQEELRKREELLTELADLEDMALDRYYKDLEEKVDGEFSALADGLPQTEEFFRKRLSQKLSAIVSQYGNFGFIVWDWEPPVIENLFGAWDAIYAYEVETDSDYHCIVVSDQPKSGEWAQEVFDSFFSLNDLKCYIGLSTVSEAVDALLYKMAREFIPVIYK